MGRPRLYTTLEQKKEAARAANAHYYVRHRDLISDRKARQYYKLRRRREQIADRQSDPYECFRNTALSDRPPLEHTAAANIQMERLYKLTEGSARDYAHHIALTAIEFERDDAVIRVGEAMDRIQMWHAPVRDSLDVLKKLKSGDSDKSLDSAIQKVSGVNDRFEVVRRYIENIVKHAKADTLQENVESGEMIYIAFDY
ncbi:hypothetical protein BDZ89DRAFT_1130297 [Hymenopellis radicata]|nr:hypothetical protein BDZ89DRAFT_1130297 [Hymenopellis radicata]